MDWFVLAVPVALLPIVWLIRLVGCISKKDFDIDRPDFPDNPDFNFIALKQKDLVLPEGGENPYFPIKCWVRLRDRAPAGEVFDIGVSYRTPAGSTALPRLDGLEHREGSSPGTALLCFLGLEANVEYESIQCVVYEAGGYTALYEGECSPAGPLQSTDAIIRFVRFPETEEGRLEPLNCLTPA